MTETTNFPELAETIRKNMEPTQFIANRGDFVKADYAVIPHGMEMKSLKPFLDEYRIKPDRRTGTAVADTLPSFIDIANRFKGVDSAVFARAKVSDTAIEASLTAVFNYHPAGGDNTLAQFSDHRAIYHFPLSKDFRFWLSANGRKMGQLDFAQFLEDRILDLSAVQDGDREAIGNLSPSFADPLMVLQLARDLEIHSNETFRQKVKLSSGETEMKFTSENKDATGQPVQIPDFFVIQLPLFEGGQAERILVRLRYRVGDGKVTWWYDLYRVDAALESAFNAACFDVSGLTTLPLYIGAPETVR